MMKQLNLSKGDALKLEIQNKLRSKFIEISKKLDFSAIKVSDNDQEVSNKSMVNHRKFKLE